MALVITITDAGRAALVNAQANGTAPVAITGMGLSAAAITPSATMTALPGEHKRVTTLSGTVLSPALIHLIARDESADVYTVRAIGLYLSTGVLFAVYGQATPIVEKAAAAVMLMPVDVRFVDVNATSLTFGNAIFVNPPATEAVQGVAEIATQAETEAGTDDSRIVTPKKIRAAITAWLGGILSDVWRASNDGAGSGLDADLLDGQQGSWYSNIAARLGFTPANRAGDIFTGTVRVQGAGRSEVRTDGDILAARTANEGAIFFGTAQFGYLHYTGTAYTLNGAELYCGPVNSLVWNAGNDGAGSGMDADLLDGQQGSWYSNIPARLGFTPANRAGDIFTGTVSVQGAGRSEVRTDGDILAARTANEGCIYFGTAQTAYLYYSGSVYYLNAAELYCGPGNSIVWNAGNDGAGSGMDADLLDGYQGAAYARIVASDLRSNGGYRVFADGLKECWGTINIPPNSGAIVTIPTPHSQWINISIGQWTHVDASARENTGLSAKSLTSFTIYNAEDYTLPVDWSSRGV